MRLPLLSGVPKRAPGRPALLAPDGCPQDSRLVLDEEYTRYELEHRFWA